MQDDGVLDGVMCVLSREWACSSGLLVVAEYVQTRWALLHRVYENLSQLSTAQYPFLDKVFKEGVPTTSDAQYPFAVAHATFVSAPYGVLKGASGGVVG